MRSAEVSSTAVFTLIGGLLGTFVSFVEPHVAGILGGVMYFIVRHEIDADNTSFSDFIKVLITGFIGAWFSLHIVHLQYPDLSVEVVRVISFSLGFMSYDFFIAWGTSSKSITASLFSGVKDLVHSKVSKWKS